MQTVSKSSKNKSRGLWKGLKVTNVVKTFEGNFKKSGKFLVGYKKLGENTNKEKQGKFWSEKVLVTCKVLVTFP